MMSAKMASLGFHKTKVFSNQGHDIKISLYDVTNKVLSRDSSCILDVVMWPNFGNCSTFVVVKGKLQVLHL